MTIRFLLLLSIFSFYGQKSVEKVSEDRQKHIPDIVYHRNQVFYNSKESVWINTSDSSVVSGFVIERYADGAIWKRFGLVDGRKQGPKHTYFPTGEQQFLENYTDNHLNGEVKRWSLENGHQLIAHLSYKDGRLHGLQRKWYSTGELHKLMQINMGQESGLQQAFRKNGALYANYEAKNGRIFGLKRSNLCYQLKNEELVYAQ